MTSALDMIKSLNAPDRGFPPVASGDTVRVHVKIVETDANGKTKSRIQVFQGVVIRVHGGGQNQMFTVRRIASHGIGVERMFLYRSPNIDKIEVLRHGKVRRAQLYYMRNLSGKSARLKERRVDLEQSAE